jgi:hypothetical protein
MDTQRGIERRAISDELGELDSLIGQTEGWAASHPDEFAPKLTLQSLVSRRAELEDRLIRSLFAPFRPPVDVTPPGGRDASPTFVEVLAKGYRDRAISEEDLLIVVHRVWLGEPTAAVARATGHSERETLQRWQRILRYLAEHTELAQPRRVVAPSEVG